jgi:hypothetical protein
MVNISVGFQTDRCFADSAGDVQRSLRVIARCNQNDDPDLNEWISQRLILRAYR